MYTDAINRSSHSLVERVMDTLEEYQSSYKRTNGVYASGAYDSLNGVRTITDLTEWSPSLDEGIVYDVKALNGNSYQISATLSDNTVICMTYPQRIKC